MNKKLQDLQAKIEKLNKEIRDNFELALKDAAQDIFNKFPKLDYFYWTQYTPYFNDGEPCEFGISGDQPGYQYGEYESTHWESAVGTEWNPQTMTHGPEYLKKEAEGHFESLEEAQALEEALSEFTNALYAFERHIQAVLGEGKIIVTRNGIEVEDYDHD